MARDDDAVARVPKLAEACPPLVFRPCQFTIAWSSVLVLAFDGFPDAAVDLVRHTVQSSCWRAVSRPCTFRQVPLQRA